MSRERRELKQVSPEKPFGMYCCGPTVYGPAHIGNFRTFLLQDVLRRTLEVDGIKVRHVRNITDVDDKTIRRSHIVAAVKSITFKPWFKISAYRKLSYFFALGLVLGSES